MTYTAASIIWGQILAPAVGHLISAWRGSGTGSAGAWNMVPRVCAQLNNPERFFVFLSVC